MSKIELELMATGSQPVNGNLRTWDFSVELSIRMRVNLFSNPVDTVNDTYHAGDHDIDEALARVCQEKLNELVRKANAQRDGEIEVRRVDGREVVG